MTSFSNRLVSLGTLAPATRADTLLVRRAVQSNERAHNLPVGVTDWDTLTYVCTDCGTLGATHDRENRDNLVAWYDFTCCSAQSTFVVKSEILSD